MDRFTALGGTLVWTLLGSGTPANCVACAAPLPAAPWWPSQVSAAVEELNFDIDDFGKPLLRLSHFKNLLEFNPGFLTL